jgi:membrane-associated phospholipid phosphatase
VNPEHGLRFPPLRAADRWVWGPPIVAVTLLVFVYLTRTNAAIFIFVNSLSGFTGDTVWALITIFGDGTVVSALLLPLVHRRPDIVWAMALATVFAVFCVHGLKPWLDLPRPPGVFATDAIHIIGPAYRTEAFPSGHTATIFTLVGVLALSTASRSLRWALVLSGTAVGLSRIVVGVHWPVDVLGGALGGWLVAVGGVWTARYWSWGLRPMGQRLLAVLLVVSALTLLFSYDTGYDEALTLQRFVGGACLIAGASGIVRLFRVRRETATNP